MRAGVCVKSFQVKEKAYRKNENKLSQSMLVRTRVRKCPHGAHKYSATESSVMKSLMEILTFYNDCWLFLSRQKRRNFFGITCNELGTLNPLNCRLLVLVQPRNMPLTDSYASLCCAVRGKWTRNQSCGEFIDGKQQRRKRKLRVRERNRESNAWKTFLLQNIRKVWPRHESMAMNGKKLSVRIKSCILLDSGCSLYESELLWWYNFLSFSLTFLRPFILISFLVVTVRVRYDKSVKSFLTSPQMKFVQFIYLICWYV